ncbi:RNA methyltransferase [Halostagnicola larsenii XH-48]|uniref:RNA methyltransferase n=1 Tax=Halostagnicola larsenii XH-48 TaxID=797299 RepID=W0JQ56_9EURY|nr:METTL5 family protein [Halostagnicola larsenii]AHF99411.1 RNA methyltransferase [Halostagnicola larsenii XH-48]
MCVPQRRTLARRLEGVDDFRTPSADLEQYLTPAEVAAHVCQFAALQGDLAGETVVDLGTGTGMLAIGAALCDAERVVGIDVDEDALTLARENARAVIFDGAVDSAPGEGPSGWSPIEWIRGDVTRPPLSIDDATVLSNPPFGAQRGNRHADRDFLETTRAIAATSYTIHNEGSQEFVESYANDAGGTVTHAFRATFSLANRLEFHTDETRTLEAEVFRIEWDSNAES